MSKRHYDWNKNFAFSNDEKEAHNAKVRYSPEMLNTYEALEYLGITRKKIKSLIDSGELNPIVIRDENNRKKFSYHFSLEELSIIRLEMIFG